MSTILNDAFVLASSLDRLSTFPDVVRGRLFDVNVFSRPAGKDCHQGVPVVWSRRRNSINFLVFQKLTHITITFYRQVMFFEILNRTIDKVLVRITDGYYTNAFDIAKLHAVPAFTELPFTADTDDRKPNIIIGAANLRERCRHGYRGTGNHRTLNKISTT